MREKDLQDYLYEHPELLFPGCRVQEKAREYAIHGKRIDLLFRVDGVRYIVELKGVALQRDHIGQVVEYYGLMKVDLKEANLRMILVAPSIPEWRAKYLEELGIRCVEIPEVPDAVSAGRIAQTSGKIMREEKQQLAAESSVGPGDRLKWDEATVPATARTCTIAHRFLRDSLELLRPAFSEYEIVPYCITMGYSPDVEVQCVNDELRFRKGGVWWAYRFGASEEAPVNDVPNVSVITFDKGIEVILNSEIQPAQKVVRRRLRSNPGQFNQIAQELAGLTLKMWLKYEHQPKFYHWILCVQKGSGEFDAAVVLQAFSEHEKRFRAERDYWIGRIVEENRNLSDKLKEHLERANQKLNLATRFSLEILEENPFWRLDYEGQVKQIVDSVIRLKPLLDFFIEDERK
jgi:hypothetical protein